jgi:hypothetical protein
MSWQWLTTDRTVLYGVSAYILIFLITLGYLIRHGRSSMRRRLLQAVAAIAWPLYWLVIIGVPGTIAVLLSAVGEILCSVVSLFSMADRSLGRPGETLRWVYFLLMVGFPLFYIYGHWKIDSSWWSDVVVIAKAVLWAPFWPVYLVGSLYYG